MVPYAQYCPTLGKQLLDEEFVRTSWGAQCQPFQKEPLKFELRAPTEQSNLDVFETDGAVLIIPKATFAPLKFTAPELMVTFVVDDPAINDVVPLNVPVTSSLYAGEVVAIPRLPELSIVI